MINNQIAVNDSRISNEEFKGFNFDVSLSIGCRFKLDEKNQIEIIPIYRYSIIEGLVLSYHGNMWNVALKLRCAFGS